MSVKKKKKKVRDITWYISTTMMGSSARTFRDRDPRGMMVCWNEKRKKEHNKKIVFKNVTVTYIQIFTFKK